MLVVKDLKGDTPDGVNFYLNIDSYQQPSDTDVLFQGITCTFDAEMHEKYKNFPSRKLLNLWQPCEFVFPANEVGQNAFEQTLYFTKIYTICPYTAKWLNNLFGDERHEAIFYPFHESVIPERQEKIYDVVYFGGLHGIDHYECINEIRKFNYRFISQQKYGDIYTPTDFDVPFKEKIDIVAKSKISVCYNLLHFQPHHQQGIVQYERWQENEAFAHMDDWGRAPQFKQRVHESAFSRTLILCKRDHWNIIEDYYTPGEDFIYFNENSELEGLIRDILNNYSDYEQMIENAYNKSLNYTSEKLYEHIKNNKKWK
jgi:hypothetical protein